MAYWILALVVFAGTASAKTSRIVGGQPTTIDNYPAVVQVDNQNPFTGTWSHNCGGSILTRRTILSAASCFSGPYYMPRLRRIRSGSTYRNNGGQINYVLIETNHPDWDKFEHYEGDLTLALLRIPLDYSPVVARTSIPPQGTVIPSNVPVVFAGWGLTSEGGSLPETLQDVTVFTVDRDVCAEIYRNRPLGPVDINEHHICAGLLGVGGKDACLGDSGGPMYYGNITIGIVSFGEGCAREDYPGVSTSVSSYTEWIVEHTV